MIRSDATILHLDDEPRDAELVLEQLRSDGFKGQVRHVSEINDFVQALGEGNVDLILSDFGFPNFDGNTALRVAKEKAPDIPFIFVTGSLGEERAIETFSQGATDYILKDRLARLVPAIRRALDESAERSERRKAEEQIREQARLLDLTSDAILVCDLEDQVRFVNRATESMFGWSREEVVGRKVTDLWQLPSENYLEAKRLLFEFGKWSGELDERTKESQRIIVSNRWSLLRDHGAVLVTKTDVTDKKKLESQLLRAQRLESIGTLASGIAHDLNNILAPILMAAELLQLKTTDPESAKWIGMLEASAVRGTELVRQILAFARGNESRRVHVHLRHLVSDIQKLLRETLPSFTQLEVKIPSDLWAVSGDPTQLHQVLLNLCINARDAMPSGGTIRISAENLLVDETFASQHPKARPGPHIVIGVSDTGIGMEPHVMERAFDPFFTTKEVGKGTGLGLSTVMTIVTSHGGFLDLHSEVGIGTRFAIYLPALTSAVAPSPRGHSVLPRGCNEGILVVDDEAALTAISEAALKSHGYRVYTANDGTEGVAIYAQNRNMIDLVLVDVIMPYMDGPATIRALQKIAPSLKIVALSGLAESEKIAQMAQSSRIEILAKPFTTEQLLTTVHRILHPEIAAAGVPPILTNNIASPTP